MTLDNLHALIANAKGHLADGLYRTCTPLLAPDGEQARLHGLCLRLEQQGLIQRHSQDKFHVCWTKAAEKPPEVGVSNEPTTTPDASQGVQGGSSQAVFEPVHEGSDGTHEARGDDAIAENPGT